jgi:biotin synthase-related radical SAM superfamily protein
VVVVVGAVNLPVLYGVSRDYNSDSSNDRAVMFMYHLLPVFSRQSSHHLKIKVHVDAVEK